MNKTNQIFLIDGDLRRLIPGTLALTCAGIDVKPFGSTEDFILHSPNSGLVLIHDDEKLIFELVEFLATSEHWLPHIAYSEDLNAPKIVQAMRRDSLDYLVWPFDIQRLCDSITEIEEMVCRTRLVRQRTINAQRRVARLTPRELEVLQGVAMGKSSSAMARSLGISNRTVDIHRLHILSKMQVSNSAEAVRIALEAGMYVDSPFK